VVEAHQGVDARDEKVDADVELVLVEFERAGDVGLQSENGVKMARISVKMA